jgi:hypothetical protein
MRSLIVGATLLAVAVSCASAVQPTYELAVDVPSILGGTQVLPQQVVRHTGAGYAAVVSLPPQVAIGALHRRGDGAVLFAPTHNVVLGGVTYGSRDVVAYNGSTYSLIFDGSVMGVPGNARIDALFLDPDGSPVLSFDVPVKLATVWRMPSSLLRFDGAWTQVWDGPAAGVPASVNVVGADRSPSGELVVTFDIPIRIAGTLFRQGQLVRWTGTAFEDAGTDPTWPPSAQLRDFSFLPAAGDVAETLRVDKDGGSALSLSWSASCVVSDADYEVYQGSIPGGFSNHVPALCSTAGATSASLPAPAGDSYFLIVPRNGTAEGSYGKAGDGSQRPASSSSCLPSSVSTCGL